MPTLNFDWSLLFQIPLVGAFIWYSIAMQKQYQDSMQKRDEAYLNALNRIAEDVKTNTRAVDQMLDCVANSRLVRRK
jgi:hypothetical protein